MKADSVHGDGAWFVRTSCKVGRRAQYGPRLPVPGIAKLNGLEGISSVDIPSSSASQSENTDDAEGEGCLELVRICSEGGLRCFDIRVAFRRYFMGTWLPFLLLPQTDFYV